MSGNEVKEVRMLNYFTQIVYTVGRIEKGIIHMLGTGFLVDNGQYIAVPRHVVGDNDIGLCVIPPTLVSFDEYQDTSIDKAPHWSVRIEKIDNFRDIVLLSLVDIPIKGILPTPSIGSTDDVFVGEDVYVIGFPHCVEGRQVLTLQKAMIGAKILIENYGIKSKYCVINTQTRPGQSGSMLYSVSKNKIIGMLIGAFAADSCISLGGVNPRELHQTTQCLSAEYIQKMIGGNV